MGAVTSRSYQKGGSVVSLGPARPLRLVVILARGSVPSDSWRVRTGAGSDSSREPTRLGWVPGAGVHFKQNSGAGSGFEREGSDVCLGFSVQERPGLGIVLGSSHVVMLSGA